MLNGQSWSDLVLLNSALKCSIYVKTIKNIPEAHLNYFLPRTHLKHDFSENQD